MTRLLLILAVSVAGVIVGLAANSYWWMTGVLLAGGILLAAFLVDADV